MSAKKWKEAWVYSACCDPVSTVVASVFVAGLVVFLLWGDKQYTTEFQIFQWVCFAVLVARYVWFQTHKGRQQGERRMGPGQRKTYDWWVG